MPLRAHLGLLVVGAVLPPVFFSMFLVARFVQDAGSEVQQRLRLNADDLARAVDRQFETAIAALEVLAEARTLDAPGLDAFYEQAAAARQRRGWGTLVLIRSDGAQVLNLLRPLGTAMPNVGDRAYFREAVSTRRPAVSELYRGSLTGRWVVAIAVPVVRHDGVRYVLAAIIYARALEALVAGGAADQEWTRAIVDRSGVIAARTRAPEEYIGRRATPDFLARTAAAPSGTYTARTIDGVDVLGAFARAPLSGWTAAVAVPKPAIEGALWRSVAGTAIVGTGMLVVGVLVALLVGRRIASDMTQATRAAEALARGRDAAVPASSVTEVWRLGAALAASARLLGQRERERGEALERERAASAQEASARREAEAASEAKDHFLAVLSHELRTPLSPVLTGIALLEREPGLSERARQRLEMLRRNVHLEARLIDDLLDLTRVVSGKVELERRQTELCTVVEHVVEVCRPDIDARRIHFDVDWGARPYWVDVDATRLQQVFWNLLKNAIKFTPPGGCVGIRCRQDGGHVAVETSDSGIGIEPDALERIFDAFAQASRATTREFGGLGLGLTISKALVEMHGGHITAQSAGPGTGATFTVWLPVVAARDVAPAGAPPGRRDRSERRRLHILLVEDHGDTAATLASMLELEGHRVTTAADVATALDAVAHADVDLLISDLGLPDASGLELMRRLRASGRRLPAIALSGYGHEHDIAASRAAGFQAHLVKPVEPERLLTAIEAAAAGSSPASGAAGLFENSGGTAAG